MHPAFSVIFFTTASGAGFGLCAWLGLLAVLGRLPSRPIALVALLLGAALAAAGLLASLGHLGKPGRAWRAFSQWRTSWLSREGVASVLLFVPVAAMLWWLWRAPAPNGSGGFAVDSTLRLAGAALLVLALACVLCTAMIYHSLKPVPAWRHPLVVPVYLAFSLYTGGLLAAAVIALGGGQLSNMVALGAIVGAFVAWRLKRITWRWIDGERSPVTRASALGLPADRSVKVFERPHTEANYLTREMGFVLARKHAHALRTIAVLLFAGLPILLALPVWLLPHLEAGPWLLGAALSALAGALVERWLFFAEARHLVTLYY
jgi:DMSO reductase anchor subunit